MNSNSNRFLNAFAAIEKYLRRYTRSDKDTSFSGLVEEASKSNASIRRYKIDLLEIAELRNAIVHQRTDGHVIAEPNTIVLEQIEHIQNLILAPPKIRDYMTKNPTILQTGASIGSAVKVMHQFDFSQVPVYEENQFVDLLTANTISRWLGANVVEGIVSLQETSIRQVLDYTEDSDHLVFLPPDTPIHDLIEQFQNHAMKGKRLEAVLVTHSGQRHETLLGMLTVWDIPKMQQSISS